MKNTIPAFNSSVHPNPPLFSVVLNHIRTTCLYADYAKPTVAYKITANKKFFPDDD